MILLNEVAIKLENILNGTDSETTTLTNPTNFLFQVETEGYHLDHIMNEEKGRNFIPVFISSMGGSYNPVANLKQSNVVIPIVFYFPVRFKESFFALNDFLVDVFVGKSLNYGTHSGRAISNISVAQFGELDSLDVLKEFQTWVSNKYQRHVEILEAYLSMTVNLYLSNADSDYVYGNDVSISLSLNDTNYIDKDITFSQASVQSQSQSMSEQIIGSNESQGLPFGVAYGSSFAVYYKNTAFYRYLVGQWFSGNAQTLRFTLTLKIGEDVYTNNVLTQQAPTFTRTCYVESVNLVVQKGELLTITFSFAKAVS